MSLQDCSPKAVADVLSQVAWAPGLEARVIDVGAHVWR